MAAGLLRPPGCSGRRRIGRVPSLAAIGSDAVDTVLDGQPAGEPACTAPYNKPMLMSFSTLLGLISLLITPMSGPRALPPGSMLWVETLSWLVTEAFASKTL